MKLVIIDGIIHTPKSALSASWLKDNESHPTLYRIEDRMLMYRNNYGEPIICRVENGAFDKADLAIALFDARETGQIEGDVQEVELPNGETFIIDADHGQDAKLPPVTW